MKHTIFMLIVTGIGTVGNFYNTFYGVCVYYLFAILRPQYIWDWSLSLNVRWSAYVAWAAIAGMIFGCPRTNTPGRRVQNLSTASAILLLFGAWVCLTGFTAHNPEVSRPFVDEYIKIFIMYFVSCVLIRTIVQLWILTCIATAVVCYITYEINYYYFVYNYVYLYRRGYGGLDNNGAALMLAMIVPCCFYVWDMGTSRWRWGALAFVPFVVHALLMSYSRGAMLSVMVCAPLVALRSRHRIQVMAFLGTFVLFGLPLLAGKEIRERFFSISEYESDGSAQSRLTTWKIGWQMACENPILGFGVRNSNLFTSDYGADMEGRTIHSQYLQIGADSGLVAVGLYAAALTSTWLTLNRCRNKMNPLVDIFPEARQCIAICNCVEGSLAVFCFGALFLSLEVVELPYLMILIGAQSELVARASLPEAFDVDWTKV